MIQEFDKEYVEKVLCLLDEQDWLFPQFALKKINNELMLLGKGGFSSVYEMYNKERPELSFSLKVIGFERHNVSSAEFWNTGRIQWILCQESKYIMRELDARELVLVFDENDVITEIKDATKEIWEETEKTLHLQFVLLEKLDELIKKDRFGNVMLLREELGTSTEVIKFALEIGQAIATAHLNKCLHRDIKIENIFWDSKEQIYKLGDFGIAKSVREGNAETIVYTDGYGAPEIERRLYDSYNATADIYSFGITLYLLLNDLKFPGSGGYYPKVEVQYNPEFVFPAPAHASERVTRIIRKMCAFYPEDRYRTMNEVFEELSMVLDSEDIEGSDELFELADVATETFREEKITETGEEASEKHEKTRAERKAEQKIVDILYREDSTKYFFAITLILALLFKGLQPDSSMIPDWRFFILPVAVVIEAVFQRIKDFHLVFGTIIVVLSVFSIYSVGLTVPHILLILFVLIGCPVLTLAGSVSTGLWMIMEYTGQPGFLDYIYRWDLGWIFLIILFLVVNRYFCMRIDYNKTTYIRAFLGEYIYDRMFPVMIFAGIVLFILKKCNVITLPDIVARMHFTRTGIISFVAMLIFAWLDGTLFGDAPETEEGEKLTDNDEFVDE